jgi:hypothetical protein
MYKNDWLTPSRLGPMLTSAEARMAPNIETLNARIPHRPTSRITTHKIKTKHNGEGTRVRAEGMAWTYGLLASSKLGYFDCYV